MLTVIAVAGLAGGALLGIVEFAAAGVLAFGLLLLAVPFLLHSRSYELRLDLAEDRVVAGGIAHGAVEVRNTGRRPALPATIDVPIGEGIIEVAVPGLKAGAVAERGVPVPALRRGVVEVGPARAVSGDPFGILRHETAWRGTHTLYVHPVTTEVPATSTGFIRDLEGSPSRRIVDADISFHAIREYAPSDARRQVHWKSTAKTGTLMVRQFEETRRARMLLLLATDPGDYADGGAGGGRGDDTADGSGDVGGDGAGDDEFELAVSVVASLGVRGIRDGRDLSVAVGGELSELARRPAPTLREVPAASRRILLDALAGLDRPAAATGLVDAAALAARTHRDVSVCVVVCGSTVQAATIRRAALAFPTDTAVAAIVCDPAAAPGTRRLGDVQVVTVALLDDLRDLLLRGAAR